MAASIPGNKETLAAYQNAVEELQARLQQTGVAIAEIEAMLVWFKCRQKQTARPTVPENPAASPPGLT